MRMPTTQGEGSVPPPDLESREGLAAALRRTQRLRTEGDWRDLPSLVPALFANVGPVRPDIRDERGRLARATDETVREICRRTESHRLVSLDEELRRTAAFPPIAHLPVQVRSHDSSDDDRVGRQVSVEALGVLSCHPSGFVREAAVAALAWHANQAVPWLLVRIVDWVPVVRVLSVRTLRSLLEPTNATPFLGCLPLLQRLRGFSRVDVNPFLDHANACVRDAPDETLDLGFRNPHAAVRRAILQLPAIGHRLDSRRLERALRDEDSGVRLRAAQLLRTRKPMGRPLCEQMMRDPVGRIRLIGVELAVGEHPDLLHRAAVDPHGGVRSHAGYYLARDHEFNARAFYRNAVSNGDFRVGVILGLGDVGTTDDWERLVPALDESPTIARAALRSMHHLAPEQTRELRLMMVDDRRTGVAKEAARSLSKEIRSGDESVIREYLRSPRLHVRLHAVALASRLSTWQSAEVLFPVTDPTLRQSVERFTSRWTEKYLGYRSRISHEDAQRVAELLAAAPHVSPGTRARLERMVRISARR
ncbi:MAG: hypothetical protein AAGF12_04425 [Myxococcota bacterium]